MTVYQSAFEPLLSISLLPSETSVMGVLSLIALAVLVALTGGLYLLGVFRQRRPGEPPLDKGLIPWLGHVLEFRRDTVKFLERMKRKHGDVFTIQVAGTYMTFIQDPSAYGQIVRESREKLDFNKFAHQLVKRVFCYHSERPQHNILTITSNKHLKGSGLEIMTQAMMSNLQNLMLHKIGSNAGNNTWNEDLLFSHCYNIVFRAGYLSLYGNEPLNSKVGKEEAKEKDRLESDALFYKFRVYDKLFPNLAFGVLPPREKQKAVNVMKYFWDALAVERLMTRDNVSGWIWDFQMAKNDTGMQKYMITRYMFVLLWASQGNTGPSSFWLLLYLMKNPEAMAAVKEEIDKVVKDSGQEVRSGGPLLDLTYEMLMKMPVLDSAVEETLRLTAAPLLSRAVLHDWNITLASGQTYLIRQGDRLSMFPYSALQVDPEIHPEPHSFKYDRFLNPDGSKKTDFYKAGNKVKFYTMPWGAGVSMCPGRFFATNELKQFVFLMLVYFDLELKNPDEKIPEIDTSRWGFGTMHPTRDVEFRYRLRY